MQRKAYRNLSDPKAVLKAIAEYDRLGQAAFLDRYGYGKSLKFSLLYKGRRYDSKAILGAAYQHQFGTPLSWKEFSGGKPTVAKLRSLGFEVTVHGSAYHNTTVNSQSRFSR
ncbi:MAG: hypothetical protein AB7Q45_04895 [Planctomycetaceae bacterium]